MRCNHRAVLTAFCLLFAVSVATAKDRAEDYNLVAKVLESNSASTKLQTNNYSVNCDTDSSGQHTDCTGRGGGNRLNTVIWQAVEMSDGNTYELQCRLGAGRRFAAGFAAGAAAYAGTDTFEGCVMKPGTYAAKKDKHGFVLRVFDQHGKAHDRAFYIASARLTAVGAGPMPLPQGAQLPSGAASGTVATDNPTAAASLTDCPAGMTRIATAFGSYCSQTAVSTPGAEKNAQAEVANSAPVASVVPPDPPVSMPESKRKPMSNVDYFAFLDGLEKALPRWEQELRRIDAEKMSDLSYSHGKAVMDERDLTLNAISILQDQIRKERVQRKVSGELGVAISLGILFEDFKSEFAMMGLVGHTKEVETWSSDELPQFNELRILLMNDVLFSVETLENGHCE